jgi:PAS domain S-box-containing protein
LAAAPDMKDIQPQQARAARPAIFLVSLVAGTVAVALLVLGLVTFGADQSRLHFEQRAGLEAENLSRMLQQNIASVIDQVDLSLRTIALEAERQGARGAIDGPAFSQFLSQQQALLPDIDSLRATDADGVVTYGDGITPGTRISITDRRYFRDARDGIGPVLVIDGPIVSRITHKPIMMLARRLNRPGGGFAGVVYAAITTEHFEKILASPDLGAHGVAVLRSAELRQIVRYPALPGAADTGNQLLLPELRAHLKTAPEHGSYMATSVLDRIERHSVYRRIAPSGLILIVAVAPRDYLAGWRPQVAKFIELGTLAILVASLSSWFVYLAWKRQHDALRALVRQQQIAHRAGVHNRGLMAASLDLLMTIGANDAITDVNGAAERVTGRARQALIGADFAACFTDPERARAAHRIALQEETVSDVVLAIAHADGKTVTPVLFNASLYRDETGALAGVFVAARDIVKLKEAEQTRERITRALRLLTDCNNLLVHAHDEQLLLQQICRLIVETGGYLLCWVGFRADDAGKSVLPAAQFGYDDGYLNSVRISWSDSALGAGPTGMAIRTGVTQVNQNCLDNPRMAPWRAAAIRRGYQSSMALPLVSDGDTLGALTIYSSEPDTFGADEVGLLEELASNVAYGIATLRVRTMKALAEQELERHRRDLEQLVLLRTGEFVAAKNEAERANRAKSRFLAAASHDLRQPLAALTLYVGALRYKLGPADGQMLANMKDCIASLSELLTDLLDLSKLEAGVVAPKVGEFAIADLLGKVVAAHAPEAMAKKLRLRLRPSTLTARADPLLLGRLLGNLVANAVRYTRQGGVLIGCRRRQGKTWIEVWDTGIGIAEDKTDEIFEEFRQLDNDERGQGKGSGLGLAIVARAAELMGLQIRVRSRPGRGSLFAVELPLGGSAGADAAAVPASAPTCRPTRIALVEDNDAVRQALAYSLAEAGHQVLAASGGAQLLALLDDRAPDIVVSDFRLGGGETGIDVINALRARFDPALAAIIITGDTDPAPLRSLAGSGVLVRHKPLDADALQAAIGELLAAAALKKMHSERG